jgi:hypothetical protein
MTQAIPHELRNKVISEYLKGKSRNEIACFLGLGAGTVTSIIQEWRRQVAEYDPESIRELAIELRKAGITADDCVRRSRITSKMRDLDIDEDKYLEVIEEIQTMGIQKGVPPEMLGELLSQLFNISRQENLRLDEIPKRLKQKQDEIKALEERLIHNKVTAEDITSYLFLKESLADIGIHDMDLVGVVNLIRNIETGGLDTQRIIRIACSTIPLEDREEVIRNQINNIQNSLSKWNHLVPLIQAIKDVAGGSVGPSVLRMLFDCISFRAAADHIPMESAAQQIMMELEELHKIVGFDREIWAKQHQIQSLEEKRKESDEFWTKDLQAIDALVYLKDRGVTTGHIIVFNTFFRGNQNKISLATFGADLNSYGSLKQKLWGLEEEVRIQTEHRENLKEYNRLLYEEQVQLQQKHNSIGNKLDSTRKEAANRTADKGSSTASPVQSQTKPTTKTTPTTKPVEPISNEKQAKRQPDSTN